MKKPYHLAPGGPGDVFLQYLSWDEADGTKMRFRIDIFATKMRGQGWKHRGVFFVVSPP